MVGGLEHFLCFHLLGIVPPTVELIFFRGVGIPPTRYGLNPMVLYMLLDGFWVKKTVMVIYCMAYG